MKNIHEILTGFGIAVPEEKKAELDKVMAENYKTVVDYDNQAGKLKLAEDKIQTTEATLKKFDGVDITALQGEINALKTSLATKDSEYHGKIAEMEFDGLLSGAVTAAKGKNVKAIRALLDVDVLKASKNQETDIKAALEALQTENGYLFDTDQAPPPYASGTGTQQQSNKHTPEIVAIRAAAGLKTE